MFDLAIYYRMVGGFVGFGADSTAQTRLRWALTIGFYMGFATLVHHESFLRINLVFLLTAVGAYLGRMIPHARFQAEASLKNSLCMAGITAARMLLIIAPFAAEQSLWRWCLPAFGIGAGIAYYVGNKYLVGRDSGIYFRSNHTEWCIRNLPFPVSMSLSQADTLDQCAVTGSEWGELLTGLSYELMWLCALVLA